ncbi:MAG: hypothetical protein LAC70_02830 [Methylovulum sp.]|jgi:hypothetical protein|nr:hypothetical protein [Methylovulum sp.]
MNNKLLRRFGITCVVILLSACASQSQPLTYLSLETQKNKIENVSHKNVDLSFSRGGFYFFNNNFRPAPDIGSYITQAQQNAGTSILRNADVTLSVPLFIDILMFGYNHGTDTITAK